MDSVYRNKPRISAIAILVLALAAAVALLAGARPAHAGNINSLTNQLNATQAHENQLSGNLANIQGDISTLSNEASVVQSREAAVHNQYLADQSALAAVQVQVGKERTNLNKLKRTLARALKGLAAELRSRYENQAPNLMSVVLNSSGFAQLLDQLNFLNRAERYEQGMIRFARVARASASAASIKLAALENHDLQITTDAARENAALSGMNALLRQRQSAANRLEAIAQSELGSAQSREAALQSQINALQTVTPSSGSGPWAIPTAIVMCESGGQNLPPNSAGASGYYQIIPSTWAAYGGTGPAAYLASEAEQNAVAAKIWDGGAGASNWVCSGIVGY
jgi:peptidoglycan hydrolase CwlO-like protein